ncbi:MAG TPA: S8 family serine peptidase [Burkholderiaceae bacterium]|nr:S8 family serine peptidase [Burkholderiaceae bacterium]HQR70977.1 S8 family serine peptidase [Burkholderiaceae bacterium]
MNRTLWCPDRYALVVAALILGWMLPAAYAQAGKSAKSAQPVYAGIIVKYKPTSPMKATAMNATALRAVEDRARVKFAGTRSGAMDLAVFRFAQPMAAAEARAAAARLALDPNVEYAVPDQVMHAYQVTPNDTDFAARQWNLQVPAAAAGGANLPPAWQRTTGSGSVVVAVVDSGIRPGHPDLAGRLLPGYDFISSDAFSALGYPANWNAADGNGRDADATDPGDYLDASLLAMLPPDHGLTPGPSSWHGTHVAGIIGAAGNNGLGVAGIDWSARILPVRVLGRDGGTTSDIIDGIAWAAGLSVPGVPANTTPARVINLSLGGPGECSFAFIDVIARARAAGAIIVAAAGNEGSLSVSQPANCNGVIAVTAHVRDGDNASYANIGTQVAVSAPGGGCGSTALIDQTGAQDRWNQSCSGCHSVDFLRQQINARAPTGVTFTKARAALDAALRGVDLDGTDTGMEGLASSLSSTERNDLAGFISSTTCAGPTDRVYSTLNLGTTTAQAEGYGTEAGTSMAAPHVSGVIALLLSLSPRLTADEVKSVLQSSARPHPAGTYCEKLKGACGSGLVDADAALQHILDNKPTVSATLQGTAAGVKPAGSFTLLGSVKTLGGRLAPANGMTWRQISGPAAQMPVAVGASITLTAPSKTGPMAFELSAVDSGGYAATSTVTVTVNSPPTLAAVATSKLKKGDAASGTLKATDADGDSITYVLITGPEGLKLDAATGAWTWTPDKKGTYTMSVMATDAYGSSAPMNVTLDVESGGIGAAPWWLAFLLPIPLVRRRVESGD